jgi:hypothetical protein
VADGLEKGKSMEVGVARADAPNAMFPHQRGRLCVVHDVPRQPWHLRDNVRQHAYPLPVLILGVRREGSSPSCPVRGCTGRSGGGINRHLTGDQE